MRAVFVVCCLIGSVYGLTVDPVKTGLIYGQAFKDAPNPYARLPAAAEGVVRGPVWSLSQNSAGLFVQFMATNAPELTFNVVVGGGTVYMWHFPPTGIRGIDVYGFDDATSAWRWMATSTMCEQDNYNLTVSGIPDTITRFRVTLPTYNQPKTFTIFAPDGATITQDPKFKAPAPVVHYGTSITQGGVASRPGMAYTNQVSRRLADGRFVYNFGFSGNGEMEIDVMQYLVTIPAAVFVIDCNWNMDADLISQRIVPLVQYIRQHSQVPVVLVEGSRWGVAWFSDARTQVQSDKWVALRTGFNTLVSQGVKDLHYVNSSQLYDEGLRDNTVGGVHPTDIGMIAEASFWTTFLPTILPSDEPLRDPHDYVVEYQSAETLSITSDSTTTTEAASSDNEASDADDWALSNDVVWTPLSIVGRILNKAFNDTPGVFNRLPSSAQAHVREAVWELSLYSTGMAVRFTTNASAIALNITLGNPAGTLWHMPPSGTSGVDLYMFDAAGSGQWRHVACPESIETTVVVTLVDDLPAGFNTFMLYLPLRNFIADETTIGVDAGIYIGTEHDDAPPVSDKNVVWYGTSILDGGVATRAGHAFENILGRRVPELSFYNFGFPGNGKLEADVVDYLLQVPNTAIFVIDCLWNVGLPTEESNLLPVYKQVRAKYPDIPVILAQGTPAPASWWSNNTNVEWEEKNGYVAQLFKQLSATDKNLYTMTVDNLYKSMGYPAIQPTVAGTHPQDSGQYAVADAYTPLFKSLVA